MLAPQTRRHEAPYGKKKVVTWNARSLASSWNFPALLHIIHFQRGGGTPSKCT